MPILPITLNNFPPARPFSNITPFTYRDGLTHIEFLQALRVWIENDIVNHINNEVGGLDEKFNESVEAMLTFVTTTINEFENEQNQIIDDFDDYVNTKLATVDSYVGGKLIEIDTHISTAQSDFDDHVISKTEDFDDHVDAQTVIINGMVTTVTTARDEAVTAKNDAVTARNQAEMFAANTATLQDAAVANLLTDENTQTYDNLVDIVEAHSIDQLAHDINDPLMHTDAPLNVAMGGTGAVDAAGARTNLELGSIATRAFYTGVADPDDNDGMPAGTLYGKLI